MIKRIFFTNFGGKRAFSGIELSFSGLWFETYSAVNASRKITADSPVWLVRPANSKSSVNQPLADATCLKNEIASKSKVWIIPNVIRITDRLVMNNIQRARSLENFSNPLSKKFSAIFIPSN